MDRDNKYYDIIEKLIKENRKYPEYEAILDEIMDDVFKHAQVIIDSIDNETVLNAYLEKVITTSIITVAKRMNFDNHLKHRVIDTENLMINNLDNKLNSQENTLSESLSDISTQAIVSNDLHAEQITTENANTTDINVNATVDVNESENIDIDFESELAELPNDQNLTTIENDLTIDNLMQEESSGETVQKANQELVDMMINSIDSDIVIKTNNYGDETSNYVETGKDFIISNNIPEDVTEGTISYSELSDVENLADLQVEDDSCEKEDNNDNITIQDQELDGITDTEPELNNLDESVDNFISDNVNNDENTGLDIETLELSDVDESDNLMVEIKQNDTEIESITVENVNNLEFDYDNSGIDDTSDDLQIESEFVNNNEFGGIDNFENTILDENNNTDLLTEDENLISDQDESVALEEEPDSDCILDLSDDQDNDDLSDELNTEQVNNIVETSQTETILEEPDEIQSYDINEEDNSLDINIENEEFPVVNDIETISLVEDVSIKDYHESSVPDHRNIDYTAFEYEPNVNETDCSTAVDVNRKILELDELKPDLQILKIFDLKYKQNLTMEQIAENLGIDRHDVVAALDELIDLI